ncbi:hypothetical protein RCL_jg14262.t1 [Rhizophagus clarus]|uniref:Uncharacterized protein n=1 Tax=Rhizophagus clarus TaxID=94130 RepID=A0A8H3QS03_9GLOM|nr:hypothetical protein RCL_jg14262.t1 [Rhizophagus clarus]
MSLLDYNRNYLKQIILKNVLRIYIYCFVTILRNVEGKSNIFPFLLYQENLKNAEPPFMYSWLHKCFTFLDFPGLKYFVFWKFWMKLKFKCNNVEERINV